MNTLSLLKLSISAPKRQTAVCGVCGEDFAGKGVTMAAPGRNTWLVIIIVAVCFAAAAAVFWYSPLGQYQQEKAIRQFIENIPGSLRADTVTVDPHTDSVELENLHGRIEFFRGMHFDVRVQKLRLEGVNQGLAKSSGVVKIADRIQIRHLSFAPDPAFGAIMGYSVATVNNQDIAGLWLDWNLLREAGEAGPQSAAFAELLLSLRLGLTIVRDASITVVSRNGLDSFDAGGCIVAVSRLEMGHYSLSGTGQGRCWNYSRIYANGARFSAKEIFWTSRSMPSGSLRMMLSGLLDRENLSRDSSLGMLKEGYSLRGLEGSDLLAVAADGQSLRIPELFLDMDIGHGNLRLNVEAPDIWISGGLVAEKLSGFNPGLGFLADRRLHLSALVDWKVEYLSDGQVRLLSHQELHEDKLGSLIMDANFIGPEVAEEERILPFALDAIFFEKGSLELEDRGFLKGFFAHGLTDDGSAARAAMAAEIKNNQALRPAFMRGAMVRFAAFLEKSGFISIVAECSSPLKLADIFKNPAVLESVSLKANYD